MPSPEECEQAGREYESADRRHQWAFDSWVLSTSNSKEQKCNRLQERVRELDAAIDRLLEACGERATHIRTGEEEGEEIEFHVHPRVSEDAERSVRDVLDRRHRFKSGCRVCL